MYLVQSILIGKPHYIHLFVSIICFAVNFQKGFGIVLDTIDRLLLNVTKNIQVLSNLKRLSQKIKIGVV